MERNTAGGGRAQKIVSLIRSAGRFATDHYRYDSDIKQPRTNEHGAYIIGFTPEKEPLIQFMSNERQPSPPPGARMIDLDPLTGTAIFKYPSTTAIRQYSGSLVTSSPDSQVDETDRSIERQKE
jgi:hypothetical protein